MKKQKMLSLAGLFILAGISQGSAVLYDIKFTGTDIWTYSADNASQARTDQAAPRRYATYNNSVSGLPDGTGPRVLQTTTYGAADGGLATTGFSASPPPGFAFDAFNLWGKDGVATGWGEKYVAEPDIANYGFNSWQVIQAPPGWTSGIVLSDLVYNPGPGAFPVWRSGTGAALSLANYTDASFVFEFIVDISNPLTAFEPDGTLRVFFGGFSDDLQGTGPENFEVSGVMILTATPIPEPTTMVAGALLLLPFGVSTLRMLRKNRTA